MMLLRRYVMSAVLKGVAVTLAVLVSVFSVIELVGELNDVGSGDYGLAEALAYVVLRVPRVVFETMPAAALIGALLGLGNLAVHRELIVMRASGVSVAQLAGSVALAGFALTVVMALLGESLAPSLGAYAREMRTQALNEDVHLADGQSAWLKAGNRILNLRRQAGEFGYGGGVLLFELAEDGGLAQIARADAAEVGPDERWVLANYGETTFGKDRISARREREAVLEYDLDSELLSLAVVREDLLDTPALRDYIRYLRANDLDARRYEVAYWARMADIVSVTLMTVLALPFVFGGLRSAGAGARLLIGLVIGLGYYVAGEMLESSGEVYNIDPLIVAWAPSAVLVLFTAVALGRIR
ncbi:MAG TPA: LPS export ABC transporter permease LptG [Gammaproteobacteria bacterium]